MTLSGANWWRSEQVVIEGANATLEWYFVSYRQNCCYLATKRSGCVRCTMHMLTVLQGLPPQAIRTISELPQLYGTILTASCI